MKLLTKEEIISIAEMNKEGVTTTEIAKKLTVHPHTVRWWLKKLKEKGYDVKLKVGRPSMLDQL